MTSNIYKAPFGCEKHPLNLEEFWEKANKLIEEDDFCPVCFLEHLKSVRRSK